MDKSLRVLYLSAVAGWLVAVGLGLFLVAGVAMAGEPLAVPLAGQVQQLALQAGQRMLPKARVEVALGALDPRLRLAPCERIQPYLPTGSRPWGRTRVGLRCLQGVTHWNVYLPVTVKVWAPALVAAAALPAGAELKLGDLREAEVDYAAAPTPPVTDLQAALGRSLQRPLAAGAPLHGADLRARQYFPAGQTVQVVAVGSGFRVSGAGLALSPGLEGQPVRVRTDGGRIVVGEAVAERRVEIRL